jgi:hypothetical protein
MIPRSEPPTGIGSESAVLPQQYHSDTRLDLPSFPPLTRKCSNGSKKCAFSSMAGFDTNNLFRKWKSALLLQTHNSRKRRSLPRVDKAFQSTSSKPLVAGWTTSRAVTESKRARSCPSKIDMTAALDRLNAHINNRMSISSATSLSDASSVVWTDDDVLEQYSPDKPYPAFSPERTTNIGSPERPFLASAMPSPARPLQTPSPQRRESVPGQMPHLVLPTPPTDHLPAAPAATATTAASAPSSRAGHECPAPGVRSLSPPVSLLPKLLHNVQLQPALGDPDVYDAHGASRGTPAATTSGEHPRPHPEFPRSPPEPRYDPPTRLWGGFAGVYGRRKVDVGVDGKEYPQLAYGTAAGQQ